jgi:hypothetical protein
MDYVFLLEDDTCLHFEFQSAYRKADLIRFAEYDLRLYEAEKRKIQTVVVYSADAGRADSSLDMGALVYSVRNIMMRDYDGDAVFAELEAKLKSERDLSDSDMLNLILLPLMKNSLPKRELAEKSIRLSQTISDKRKRDTCIASAAAFMSRYLSNYEIDEILEALKMVDVWDRLLTREITKEKSEIAIKALKEGLPSEVIARLTGLDLETIEALQEQQESEDEGA